jgi:putative redox protein
MMTRRKQRMSYQVTATWKEGLHFEGESDGQIVQLDSTVEAGGKALGPSPVRLVLIALAGCTGMDVISLLKKMRQDVTHFQVDVSSERAQEHPKVYTSYELVYRVRGHSLDRDLVEKAVNLSEDKYCSVAAMLRVAAPITFRIEIEEEKG